MARLAVVPCIPHVRQFTAHIITPRRAQAPCRAQPPLPKGTSPFRHQRRHRATAQQQAPGSSSGGADGASVASTSAPEAPAYPYNSGDSRTQKTTIEHILPGLSAAGQQKIGSGGVQAPWAMGWQMNERNMVWNDELKLRLIKVSWLHHAEKVELAACVMCAYCVHA